MKLMNMRIVPALAALLAVSATRATSSLEAVEELTEGAWQIPFALRVDSITNFQHTWADGDELIVEDLVQELEHGIGGRVDGLCVFLLFLGQAGLRKCLPGYGG